MAEQKTMVRNLTTGSVARQLLVFAMPLFVSNALQAVYNMVDMIIVGQFIGGYGMSAVSIGGDLLHLLTFVSMGFASAGQVIIARHVGEGRMDEVRETIGTLFSFLLAASVLISVVCFILRYPIMHALNTPPESFSYAMDYMVTCIVGLVFIYGYNIVSAVLRGMGDSKRPFVFVGVAAILNIILDYLFVVVFHMEVFGAALATVIGQGVSFISSLIYLYIRRQSFGFDFKLRSFAIHSRTLKPLVMLGIPMAIQAAAVNFSKVLLMSWINLEGVLYSALAGIFNKINVVGGVISMSFTAAGSSMVGQNLGARKYDRIPRILATIAVIGLGLFSAMTLVLVASPDVVFGMFTSDTAVLSLAGILVIPMILNFYGAATRSISFALINGSGNTKLNLAVALIDGIMMRIGLAALLCFGLGMGSLGCWYGDAIAGFVPFFIGLVFYLSGKWKK
ncbi:MAG: MATE family efflux transporter [Spirochaetales bacterium]|nr:MATE family efflux transporter [Spirochaetales bacterium]MBO6048410.1 MATE family efflux transporter [Spirochaetales bacterium]